MIEERGWLFLKEKRKGTCCHGQTTVIGRVIFLCSKTAFTRVFCVVIITSCRARSRSCLSMVHYFLTQKTQVLIDKTTRQT